MNFVRSLDLGMVAARQGRVIDLGAKVNYPNGIHPRTGPGHDEFARNSF